MKFQLEIWVYDANIVDYKGKILLDKSMPDEIKGY